MNELTHIDPNGNAVMVDVSEKEITSRTAVASGTISMNRVAFEAVVNHTAKKGDVLTVAQVAGIMAAKRTAELIPLCHILPLSKCSVTFELFPQKCTIQAFCVTKCEGKTGIEMEALTGVSTALLTIYDMCKAIDRSMTISQIQLEEKDGGKSGHYIRDHETVP